MVLVLNATTAIESRFPRVRIFDLSSALAEWRAQDRAYAVLDLPDQSDETRQQIVACARTYLGRWYDVPQMVLFLLTARFWNEGVHRLVCSRLVAESYIAGGHETLFPEDLLAKRYALDDPRLDNLRMGEVAPVDFLRSRLRMIDFQPSTRVRTPAGFLRR